ncbi:CPT1A [Cordylochernes scorpioides]|uniref:CPT1A n=1 Tax=Cordylochernes scorpioides TaxID=51811 RepID=A0ABY6LGC6_9ARAC|nr:CPT1A [Cordylochernes scorpioides]
MAEAHQAVAFSFSITHEGVDINYDIEVLNVVWQSGLRSWSRRIRRIRNNIANGIYPAPAWSYILCATVALVASYCGLDVTEACLDLTEQYVRLPPYLGFILVTMLIWSLTVVLWRYLLYLTFLYKGWMYETRGRGAKISIKTKLWGVFLHALKGRRPKLYSYQGSLPRLPLPPLNDTMTRYLQSVRPLLNDEQYDRMVKYSEEFKRGIGKKLQRYLWLKNWWATNYVSDWWEEYVYLRGRSPLMVNSNYYAIDALMANPTKNQASRAANLIHAAMLFRRGIDRQTMKPIMVQGVPLCSWQYERTFNTTRIPGIEGGKWLVLPVVEPVSDKLCGSDKLVHFSDSQHVVVYHKGRFFKLPVYYMARHLKPAELEVQLEKIINDPSPPQPGEEHLAALTASERSEWAKARMEYFSKGVNRNSLGLIEKAAFMVILDDDSYDYNPEDPSCLDRFGQAMLHGKGYDRWFDKSFNLIVAKNGRAGLNAEHSWADAPIIGHLWEFSIAQDFLYLGYSDEGKCRGSCEIELCPPQRLIWDLPAPCVATIDRCVLGAKSLLGDVDLHLLVHSAYGKGFMKKCRLSPDAFIQMGLQLAYYRDAGKFNLTYEASMTRLFREGRTETVRPVTMESCAWVRSMVDASSDPDNCKELLRKACQRHQRSYQDAMCGQGIDRHLFCLYVISKYLEVDSQFLKEVLSEPWRLSTSQTPQGQTGLLDVNKNPEYISAGGGFGPVADDGYGVSYIIAGEDLVFFHISSKASSPETVSLLCI